MRIFVGVELPESMRRQAAAAAEALRSAVTRAARAARIRWVEAAGLHVTLWFIGEVSDERAAAVRAVLAPPIPIQRFTLQLGSAGVFPPSGPPRALWFGAREGGDALRALHDAVEARLVPLGFEAERRPYSAHVTVARVKEIRGPDGMRLRKAIEEARPVFEPGRVETVTLFRSRTSPTGSQYDAILRVPLM